LVIILSPEQKSCFYEQLFLLEQIKRALPIREMERSKRQKMKNIITFTKIIQKQSFGE
jgi:hypothetical protein